MVRRTRYLLLAGAAVLGLGLYVVSAGPPRPDETVAQGPKKKQPGKKQPEQGGKKTKEDPAAKAVMENVRTFTDAFNRRDLTAILSLFAEDCELTEHDGTIIRGLKELRDEFKEHFDSDTKAKVSVSVDSLRVVSPEVVIEEGKTTFFPDGKTLTAETEYQAIHVKKDGKWLMSRVRSFHREVLSPYDQLRNLEWLVGDWVDEGSDSLIETSYRWDPNKAFLLQDFNIRVKGQKAMSGTQRIGWDPLTKQLKAWAFDSEGGYVDSLWSNVDESWVIKAKGVRADGKVVTTTNQITQLGKDRMLFESVDRIVGEERMPNLSMIVVRKPPPAKR